MSKIWLSLRRVAPIMGLALVFLGPFFFFSTLQFLQKVDYVAASLSFLAGWCLLRAGVDITRAALAVPEPGKPTTKS